MEWKIFWSTFALVFMAELGDKTQLATLGISADGGHAPTVFVASSAALVLSSLIAVVLGSAAKTWLPREAVRICSGIFFVAAGVLILLKRG